MSVREKKNRNENSQIKLEKNLKCIAVECGVDNINSSQLVLFSFICDS